MLTDEFWTWCGQNPAVERAISVPVVDLELELISRDRSGLGLGNPTPGNELEDTSERLADIYYSMDPVTDLSGWNGLAAELFGDYLELVWLTLPWLARADVAVAGCIFNQAMAVVLVREELLQIAKELLQARALVHAMPLDPLLGSAVSDGIAQGAALKAESGRAAVIARLKDETAVIVTQLEAICDLLIEQSRQLKVASFGTGGAFIPVGNMSNAVTVSRDLSVDLDALSAKHGRLLGASAAVRELSTVGLEILADVRETHGIDVVPEFYSLLQKTLLARQSLLGYMSHVFVVAAGKVTETRGRYVAADRAAADAVLCRK